MHVDKTTLKGFQVEHALGENMAAVKCDEQAGEITRFESLRTFNAIIYLELINVMLWHQKEPLYWVVLSLA